MGEIRMFSQSFGNDSAWISYYVTADGGRLEDLEFHRDYLLAPRRVLSSNRLKFRTSHPTL